MKILLLNQTFYPDNAATSQYLTDFGVELVKQGYSVDVVADAHSYDDRNVILPCFEIYRGMRIHRIKSTAFGKKTHLHRGLDYLSFNLSFILKMLTMPKYHIIIGLTTPPWISFFGMLFSAFKRARFIHWAMDVNPDEAIKLGWVRSGSLFHRFLEFTTKLTYKKSRKIVALDEYMAQLINNKINSKKSDDCEPVDKVVVIPPWAHDDIESIPHDKNPFRKQHNLDGKFVIMYSGNFSICHPIDTLLETARLLQDTNDIVFIFIGGGLRLSEILAFKEKHHLENIMYLPYQKRKEIKYSLSAADLHIVSMGEPYVGIVHPSKIYGILQTGRPFLLIGPKKSHIGDIIGKYKIGYQIQHGNIEGMQRVISQVMELSDSEKMVIMDQSRKLVSSYFSRAVLTQKFIKTAIRAKNMISDRNGL